VICHKNGSVSVWNDGAGFGGAVERRYGSLDE